MKEYIEREAALTAISTITMYKGVVSFETAKYRLETIPAADVRPVVLCRDCKHYKAENKGKPWKSNRSYCCRSACVATNPDDFCSYGERKGGANT